MSTSEHWFIFLCPPKIHGIVSLSLMCVTIPFLENLCQVAGLINNSLELAEFLKSPWGNRHRKVKAACLWIYFSIIYFHGMLSSFQVIYHIPSLINLKLESTDGPVEII